jgi:hypothetical protein
MNVYIKEQIDEAEEQDDIDSFTAGFMSGYLAA